MSDSPKPPLTTTTSIWPAAAVLILAVVVLGSFMLINAISDTGVKSTTTTTIPVVVGGLATDSSSNLLENCQQPDNPPSDISGALLLPVGTQSTGPTQLPNEGAGDFDCYRPLETSAGYAALLDYYQTQLEAQGWNLFSKGAIDGKPQSLFQKGGSDGFYWVVGITVNSSTTSTTNWTYTIYQNSDTV